jgi:hypothetical protein
MGTRNLTCVVLNGEMKVAQYGQWDGYLRGQGKTILDFIANKMNTPKFKKALSECRFLSNKENKKTWKECGADPDSNWVNMEVSEKHDTLYPALSRDRGAEILEMIQDGTFMRNVTENNKFVRKNIKVEPVRNLVDSHTFASDSSCEYAYTLDMDKKVLKIYRYCSLMTTVSFTQCKKKDALKKLMALEKKMFPDD